MDAVIEIREVSKSFQGQSVLERCSLNLQKERFTVFWVSMEQARPH